MTRAVVFPALMESRTSTEVLSSIQTVSWISIGRAIFNTSTRGPLNGPSPAPRPPLPWPLFCCACELAGVCAYERARVMDVRTNAVTNTDQTILFMDLLLAKVGLMLPQNRAQLWKHSLQLGP